VTRNLVFEETLKILQVANTDVGYGPVSEVAVSPVDQVIALAFHRLLLFAIRGCRRPDKQVNKMLAPLINQSCYRVVIEVIKASANQGKTITGEVHHRGCKIELRIKPGLNSVLVGRSYIREMVRHERANMARYKLRRKELIGIWLPQPRQQAGSVSCDPAGWLLASRTQVEDCLPTGFDDDRYSDVDVRR